MFTHARLFSLSLTLALPTAIAVFASPAGAATATRTFEPAAITQIELDFPSTDRLHVVSFGSGVSVRVDGEDKPECRPEFVQQGARLRVSVRGMQTVMPRGSSRTVVRDSSHCHLAVRLVAPADTAVSVGLTAGDITLNRVAAALDLRTGAGNVSGSVEGQPLKIETGSGKIDVTYAKVPVGRIDAQTGAGDVELHLPEATAAELNATSDKGSVKLGLASVPGAPAKIRATSSDGSVYVGT